MNTDNEALIKKFYQSFSDKNISGMLECYHDNVRFEDPAFGVLHGIEAKGMWEMLLSRGSNDLQVTFSNIKANEESGSANWEAHYSYGPKKRKVINKISATFKFSEGKIIDHKDYFSLWKWSQQSLGLSGYLLGWSAFLKNKIQSKTNGLLKDFLNKKMNES